MNEDMEIHALAAKGQGERLVPFIYEKKPTKDDVTVRVLFRTVSMSDIFQIDNFWHSTTYPIVPSEDIIGEVVQTGENVRDLKVGDVVGIGYQVYSCGACDYCKKGLDQFCEKQRNLRVHEHGGLSDYMIVDGNFVFPIPKNLQKPEATPLFCAGLTAFSSIIHNGVTEEMSVAVVGIGRVGHLAVKFLRGMGCKVTAVTEDPKKQKYLASLGVTNRNVAKEHHSLEKSFDFIIFTGTRTVDWDMYLKMLKPTGKLILIGLPQKPLVFDAINLSDYANRQIIGSYIGSKDDMKQLIRFASKHNILADVEIFPYSESHMVIDMVRNNKIQYSAVITNSTS
jgi:D-arabinose 1-dehydrogenase-like Zn-dependent alcohol dehydrogenase